MFFFGFTTAIALYSLINTVVQYKAAKKKAAIKAAEAEDVEAEFLKALESAFGIELQSLNRLHYRHLPLHTHSK